MIVNTVKTEGALSGLQKAAMLMIILGEETSATLLRHLTDYEAQSIIREVAKTHSLSPEESERTLQEFHQLLSAGEFVSRGGMDFARQMLSRAFEPDRSRRMIDHLSRALGADAASFETLQRADPQQLAKFIHNEHPQTIALVLSNLGSSQAAGLLLSLPQQVRGDVSQRMASLDQTSPETISRISSVICQKLKSLGEFTRESRGGVRAVAEMLNRLDSASSREILDHFDQQDPNLAESIRHLMFVFEDLLLIDPLGLKALLGKIDRKVLTIALKGTSEQLRAQVLSCLSQRGADMLKEDMETLGPVKIKDVEAAQQQIIALVRQFESEGILSLKGTVGEQYVV